MAELELSDTACAILGMIALRGPSTAYEIKRALGRITTQFWTVPHVGHYREAARLEAAGLLASRQEARGRRRRVYAATAAGRRALAAWLARPATSMEIRDLGQLKLFFGELGNREDIGALALGQAEQYRLRLEELDAIAARFAGREDLAFRLAPLRLGQAVYRAAVEFWSAIAERPPRASAERARTASRSGRAIGRTTGG